MNDDDAIRAVQWLAQTGLLADMVQLHIAPAVATAVADAMKDAEIERLKGELAEDSFERDVRAAREHLAQPCNGFGAFTKRMRETMALLDAALAKNPNLLGVDLARPGGDKSVEVHGRVEDGKVVVTEIRESDSYAEGLRAALINLRAAFIRRNSGCYPLEGKPGYPEMMDADAALARPAN